MSGKHAVLDDTLLRRVYSEFLEMPGLRLTCPQAQRLWGLDEWTCIQLLESLVDAKFLGRPADGVYARVSEGQVAYPPVRMIKARTDGDIPRRKKEAL